MWKNIVLQLRYPYTLGIITVIWFSTLGFTLVSRDILNWTTLTINILVTIYMMVLGFAKK